VTAVDALTSVEPHAADIATAWQRGPSTTLAPRDRSLTTILCTYRRPESARRFLESLAAQIRVPDQLLIVDASPDEATEAMVASLRFGFAVKYWRVQGQLRGLTRQRNFALRRVSSDLVAFFDDDIVLDPSCLQQLERAHREHPDLAGVGCFAEAFIDPSLLWRLRRTLRIVPHLRPGSYTRGGMSVPWRFHAPTDQIVEGDWLPGCAMMLKVDPGAPLLFDEALTGYAQGEDLEFSLRLRERGRLALHGAARCQHFHEAAGRPNAFKLGEMEIWNRHRIWRRAHRQPRASTRYWFAYAWTLDTLLLTRHLVSPGQVRDSLSRIAGRIVGASRILLTREV